jgi:hypothetical protein
VIQSILALGKSPSVATYVRGNANPVSALMSFQLTSGPGKGAFFFPGSSNPNIVATYQAVPAVAGVTDPFDLTVATASLPGAVEGSPYSTALAASGGIGPFAWKVISESGSLPTGLRLNRNTGTISGKPRASGAFAFAVEVFGAETGTTPATQAISWKVLSITSSPAF